MATSPERNHAGVTTSIGSRIVSIAVVFPGQGSQFVGMADPWVGHPAGRAVLEEAGDAIGRDQRSGTG